MKSKISNPFYHILFWIVVTILFILVFGRMWNNNLHAFYFISLQLPVVMATSYFFNFFLVPYYLLRRRYFWFGLYFFYTVVLSLYFQMLVVFFSYLYFTSFNPEAISFKIIDKIILLAFVMYAVVFSGSFFVMLQQLISSRSELETLKAEKKKRESPYLELISNRKLVRVPFDEILFIESLSDYVKVNTTSKTDITSKEKISTLEKRLPDLFVRIHRSFIVNREKVTGMNNNEIELGETILSIGRSYKQQALEKLKS